MSTVLITGAARGLGLEFTRQYAAELIGQCSAEMRLPMVPIAESSKKAVREAMVHAGLIN